MAKRAPASSTPGKHPGIRLVTDDKAVPTRKKRTIIVAHCPVHDDNRNYHVDVRLTRMPIADIGRHHPDTVDFRRAGKEGTALYRRLIATHGVAELVVSRYCVSVEKARVIPWTDVEPAVLALLAEIYGVHLSAIDVEESKEDDECFE